MFLENLEEKKKIFHNSSFQVPGKLKFTVLEGSLVQLHLHGSDLADGLHQFDLLGNECVFFRMMPYLSSFRSWIFRHPACLMFEAVLDQPGEGLF